MNLLILLAFLVNLLSFLRPLRKLTQKRPKRENGPETKYLLKATEAKTFRVLHFSKVPQPNLLARFCFISVGRRLHL
jgi:hypothetical protein